MSSLALHAAATLLHRVHRADAGRAGTVCSGFSFSFAAVQPEASFAMLARNILCHTCTMNMRLTRSFKYTHLDSVTPNTIFDLGKLTRAGVH